MASLVSPGVQVREIDLTNVVPAVSTSIGGYAGAFSWGPVEEVRTVSSEKDLAETFGLPPKTDVSVSQSFLTAASFLKYSSSLKVVRAGAASGYKNATSGSGGTSCVSERTLAAAMSLSLAFNDLKFSSSCFEIFNNELVR